MKSITIQGKKRESVGKKSTKALRNADLVPCVVYGEKETIHFSTEEKSFKDLVYTPEAHTVNLEIDGQKIEAILQDIQFHPVSDKIIHADFYQLDEKKPVTMDVPVIITGRAKGVMKGGVLRINYRKLKVRSLPADLPDEIVVNVTPLNIGSKLEVGSLKVGKYKVLHPDNTVIAAVRTSRAAMKGDDDGDDDETSEEGAKPTEEGAKPTEE